MLIKYLGSLKDLWFSMLEKEKTSYKRKKASNKNLIENFTSYYVIL